MLPTPTLHGTWHHDAIARRHGGERNDAKKGTGHCGRYQGWEMGGGFVSIVDGGREAHRNGAGTTNHGTSLRRNEPAPVPEIVLPESLTSLPLRFVSKLTICVCREPAAPPSKHGHRLPISAGVRSTDC